MRLALVAIQIVLLAGRLWGDTSLSTLLDASIIRDLEAHGTLTESLDAASPSLLMAPRVDSREKLAEEARRFRPSVGIETLRVIRGCSVPVNTPAGYLRLYNILHATSSMQGITYFSASRKRDVVLFAESYVIESARRTARIPDPVFSSIPVANTMYTFQSDQSFGKGAYKEDFTVRSDHLLVGIENVSAFSFLFVPVVRPGGFVSRIVLVPSGADLVFYGLSYVRTSVPLGDSRSEQSLKNRMIALLGWLESALRS